MGHFDLSHSVKPKHCFAILLNKPQSNIVSIELTFFNNFSSEVNFEELARCTDDFNGAQCKAVCVEAVSLNENIANSI